MGLFSKIAKRISTETTLGNDSFNIKMGTLNKANPDTIYMEIGTFITPSSDEVPFEDIMNTLEKSFKRYLTFYVNNTPYFTKDFICVFDVATNRMKVGKKSYLLINCHFKQKEVKKLDEMEEELTKFIGDVTMNFARTLKNSGFDISKTKKD